MIWLSSGFLSRFRKNAVTPTEFQTYPKWFVVNILETRIFPQMERSVDDPCHLRRQLWHSRSSSSPTEPRIKCWPLLPFLLHTVYVGYYFPTSFTSAHSNRQGRISICFLHFLQIWKLSTPPTALRNYESL